MSMSDCVYVGAFVLIENSMEEKPVIEQRCKNPACHWHNKYTPSKFCPYCGVETAMLQRGTVLEERVDWFSVSEAIDQDLWRPEIPEQTAVVWLPNKSAEGETGYHTNYIKGADYGAVELSTEEQDEQANALLTRYDSALRIMREMYGADNVKAMWGMVKYIQ